MIYKRLKIRHSLINSMSGQGSGINKKCHCLLESSTKDVQADDTAYNPNQWSTIVSGKNITIATQPLTHNHFQLVNEPG